jgi:hypothetical protein
VKGKDFSRQVQLIIALQKTSFHQLMRSPPPLQLHAFNDHNSLVPVPLDDCAASGAAADHSRHPSDCSLEVVGAPPPLVLLR